MKHTEREAAVRVVSGVLIMACMLLSSYLFVWETKFIISSTCVTVVVGLIQNILWTLYHVQNRFLSYKKTHQMNQQETTIMGATTVNLLTFDNCIISHRINILVLVQVTYIMTVSLCIWNEVTWRWFCTYTWCLKIT